MNASLDLADSATQPGDAVTTLDGGNAHGEARQLHINADQTYWDGYISTR